MKVEVSRDKFLSNYEVFEHLKDVQNMHRWKFDPESKKDLSNKKYRQNHLVELELITRDLFSYLSKSEVKFQTQDSITQLITGLKKFELEKIEVLQILNFTPRNMVLLYSIIEECDQRFTEQECEEMLTLVTECFPVPEEGQVDNNDDGDVEMKDGEEEDDEFEEAQETLEQ